MLLKCSSALLVAFLGTICGSASRALQYEDDNQVPVRVDDFTRNLTAAQVDCVAGQVDGIWDNLKVHVQRPPDYVSPEGVRCSGGHLASGYITALQNNAIRGVKVTLYNRATGLLKVAEYEYTNGGQKCRTKTLWNDFGDSLGAELKKFPTLVTVGANFPDDKWAVYNLAAIESTCKDIIGNNPGMLHCTPGTGDRAVSSYIQPPPPLKIPYNICVKAVLGGTPPNVYASSCYPVTYTINGKETLALLGKAYPPGSNCPNT